MKVHNYNSTGFALLLALLVVSVVITVGLTILEITTKQVRLAASAADSEISYSAANAGVECAMYWRRKEAGEIEMGNAISNLNCFGSPNISPPAATIPVTNGQLHLYKYQIGWGGAAAPRCSRVSIGVIVSSASAVASVERSILDDNFSGYPGTGARTCPAGGICTIISSKGFNRDCVDDTDPFPPGTIEREVLVEF